jgi:hypothetical protein
MPGTACGPTGRKHTLQQPGLLGVGRVRSAWLNRHFNSPTSSSNASSTTIFVTYQLTATGLTGLLFGIRDRWFGRCILKKVQPGQDKPSSNTPVMQKTRRAPKQRGRYAHKSFARSSQPAPCPFRRRASWAVRRFDSLVEVALSEVPNVALCLCAQGEGAFLRIAPVAPQIHRAPG